MVALLRRLLSSDSGDPVAEAGLALLRISTGGMVAVLHGWHKVAGGLQYAQLGSHWPLLDDTVAMGFPAPVLFTAVAAAIQLLGGLMLALGLCTRIVALLVASTLATALVFNLQTGGPDAQLAGLYALVTGAFVLIGGGRWSLDRRVSGANDRGRYK